MILEIHVTKCGLLIKAHAEGNKWILYDTKMCAKSDGHGGVRSRDTRTA